MSNQNKFQDDEMSLKELILIIKDYGKEVFRKKWTVAGVCILSIIGALYVHVNHEVTYKAELKFVVEGQNNAPSGLGGILGSLGLNRGSSLNHYKIKEVGKSTDIFIKSICSPSDSGLNIANTIIEKYELDTKWEKKNPEFSNFRFNNDKITTTDGPLEQKALKKIKKMVWGTPTNNENALSKLSYGMESGIYSLSSQTNSESLSIHLTESIYREIKHFFENEMLANQQELVEILSIKADSIKNLTDSKIRELARFDDRNRGLIGPQMLASRNIILKDNQVLYAAYAEIMKSKEMTDVTLRDIKPLFLAIDTPFSPLSAKGSSIIKKLITGLLFGVVISIFFLFGFKFFRDIMNS